MDAHSHNLNNHTHSFTPSGTVSSHNHSFYWTGAHKHGIYQKDTPNSSSSTHPYPVVNSDSNTNTYASSSEINDYNAGGKLSLAYSNFVKLVVNGDTDSVAPSFTGSSGTTGGNNDNTTSTTSTGSFTGSAGTTDTSGKGTAFSIIPPYVVKYCWERTA